MLGRRLLRLLAVILLVSAPATAAELTPPGEQLIVDFEVGGRSAYERRYQWPVCPACDTTASGVTMGIGYDLRHNSRQSIARDWAKHPKLPRLLEAQGLGGQAAIAKTRTMRDVITPWPMAMQGFRTFGIVPYSNLARRIFGREFDLLSPFAQDALRSLVYNRGGSMVGRSRLEFRFIRDVCMKMWAVPESANACVSRKIRDMTRIWRGSAIEGGMTRRRYAEADLALYAQYPRRK